MDIKGTLGTAIENPPSSSRTDTETVHPTQATSASKAVGQQALSRIWQVGALLQLTVSQMQGKNVTLSLPQAGPQAPQIQTQTDLPLVPGQLITARVTGGLEKPALQLVDLQRTPQDLMAQTLRQQLPQQRNMPPLLANLGWLAKQPANPTNPLLNAISQLSRQIVEQLPQAAQITEPQKLRQALQHSGVFLENTLLKQASGKSDVSPEQDVRTQLLRMAQALRQQAGVLPSSQQRPSSPPSPLTYNNLAVSTKPTPADFVTPRKDRPTGEPPPPPSTAPLRSQAPQPQANVAATLAALDDPAQMAEEMLQQIEGALSRIQSQQLQSLQTDQQGRPVWIMELPLRHDDGVDVFDFRLQRDAPDQEQGEQARGWSMTIAFDLEGLGPLRVKVHLQGEALVNATFWAEWPVTRKLFHDHMEQLRSRLQHVGLDVNQLSCKCGVPPEPPVYGERRLLDERA